MKSFFKLSSAIFLVLIASSFLHGQNDGVPQGWKQVKECNMSFLIPDSFERQNTRGRDSCVTEYKDAQMRLILSLDYVWYNGPIERQPYYIDYKVEPFEIDEREGRLATYTDRSVNGDQNIVARLFLYNLSWPKRQEGNIIDMYVFCSDSKYLEVGKRIFKSIRFEKR